MSEAGAVHVVSKSAAGAVETARPETRTPGFVAISSPIAARLFRPVAAAYLTLASPVSRGRRTAWLVREDFLFFLLAGLGALAAAPPAVATLFARVDQLVWRLPFAGGSVAWWPDYPGATVPLVGLALLVFFLDARTRMVALIAGALVFGRLLDSRTDVFSLVLLGLFLLPVFVVIKLPLPRSVVVAIVTACSLAFMTLCTRWPLTAGREIAGLAQFQMTLLPMLWYSVYRELPPRNRLHLWQFLVYQYSRFFNAPAVTYQDVFDRPRGPALARVRFAGFKALYIAFLAGFVSWFVPRMLGATDGRQATGLALLGLSYLTYVAGYCQLVVVFNTFIGIARLFGLPVRDNFNYWLFARTPNEHWQRWNLLFREWILTFVFFPIMRAKRWLFAAVVAALMTSGVLHVAWLVITGEPHWFHVVLILSYWFANALAIYLVLKVPMLFPRAIGQLKLRKNAGWSVAGIVLTSAFYAVTNYVRGHCDNWADVAGYFHRLMGL